MRIHRLYTDKNGESHFQDVEIEYAESTRSGRLSKRLPATGIIFREVQPDYDLDWHPAPRRQYIINLDAGVQITASDGEARRIGAGEVLLVEDTHGKGHLSKALDGKLRNCNVVTLELQRRAPVPVCASTASTARRDAVNFVVEAPRGTRRATAPQRSGGSGRAEFLHEEGRAPRPGVRGRDVRLSFGLTRPATGCHVRRRDPSPARSDRAPGVA